MNGLETEALLPSPWSLALALIAIAGVVAAAPRQKRMFIALAVMAFTLTAARLVGLAEYAGLAKLSSGFTIAVVAVTAFLHPGPKRRMPLIAAAFPALAFASVVLVSGAADSRLAMAKQLQWFAMTVAATLVCRRLVDTAVFHRTLKWLLIGVGGGSVLALSSLAVDPSGSFRGGLGRFTPYDCNPNQIATAFSLTATLGMYLVAQSRALTARGGWSLVVTLGAVGGVLSVSRMAYGAMALGSAPSLTRLVKRPAYAAVTLAVIAIGVAKLTSAGEDFDLSHIDNSSTDSRWVWTAEVLKEVGERPWFGLLFANREAYAEEEGLNAHNAYVEVAYLCGLVHAIPNLVLALAAAASSVWVAANAKRMRFDTLLLRVVCAIQLASVVNGLANNIIYYPMYTWAFMHVMLSQFVLCQAGPLKLAARQAARPQRPLRGAPARSIRAAA